MADLNGTTVYSLSEYQSNGGYEPAQNVAFAMPVWNIEFSEYSGISGVNVAFFLDPRYNQVDNAEQIYPRGDGSIKIHID